MDKEIVFNVKISGVDDKMRADADRKTTAHTLRDHDHLSAGRVLKPQANISKAHAMNQSALEYTGGL